MQVGHSLFNQIRLILSLHSAQECENSQLLLRKSAETLGAEYEYEYNSKFMLKIVGFCLFSQVAYDNYST
jgi:hypothetical protein